MHEEKCKNKTRTAAWFGERETTEKNELEHDLVHEEKRHDLVHNEDHKKTRTVARLGERRKIQKKNEMEHDFVHDKKMWFYGVPFEWVFSKKP